MSLPNKVDSKYEKNFIELEGEMDKIPIAVKDFHMFPQLLSQVNSTLVKIEKN